MYLFKSNASDEGDGAGPDFGDMAGAGSAVENSAGKDNEKSSGGSGGSAATCSLRPAFIVLMPAPLLSPAR
jgi:hypothetical protein